MIHVLPLILFLIAGIFDGLYTSFFTDRSKDGDNAAAAFIWPSFEFSKRIPDKLSNFKQ